MFRKPARAAIAACTLLLTAACFEIEQTIELERDLSGRAGVRVGVNFEPLVLIMSQVRREMEGKEGPPSAAEMEAARKEFLEQSERTREQRTVDGSEIEGQLPEGIEMLDFALEEKDLGVVTTFRFAFDSVSRLAELRLPSSGDDPTRKNVVETPFGGLQLTDAGDTFTIQSNAQNPASGAKGEAKGSVKVDADTEKLMEKAFQDLRVAYRITAPFEVVSHNATRVEKDTLIWEYDYDTFKRMEASKQSLDLNVRVTYRR